MYLITFLRKVKIWYKFKVLNERIISYTFSTHGNLKKTLSYTVQTIGIAPQQTQKCFDGKTNTLKKHLYIH